MNQISIKCIFIDTWINNPTDCLALVILLNQLTRSVYRNTPDMFSG